MPAGACERRNSNGHRRSIMIPRRRETFALCFILRRLRNSGTFWRGAVAAYLSSRILNRKSGNWEFWRGGPAEITPLCRPDHDLPARGKSHHQFLVRIAPKFPRRIAPTAVELVFLGRRFGECSNLFSVCRLSSGRVIHSRMSFRRVSWSSMFAVPWLSFCRPRKVN
jgi:hypothetical protein